MDTWGKYFWDRIIRSGLWSVQSSDLNPCKFHLCNTKVHRSNFHTSEKLNENIWREVYSISQEEFQCLNVERNGMHVERERAFLLSVVIWLSFICNVLRLQVWSESPWTLLDGRSSQLFSLTSLTVCGKLEWISPDLTCTLFCTFKTSAAVMVLLSNLNPWTTNYISFKL